MRWMICFLAAAAMLLSGCASIVSEPQSNIDFARVARIETAAREVGVKVYWVNYPTKPETALN